MRPHAVTGTSGQTYGYDANGNMSSRAGKTLTWSADNSLASLVGPDNVTEGYGLVMARTGASGKHGDLPPFLACFPVRRGRYGAPMARASGGHHRP